MDEIRCVCVDGDGSGLGVRGNQSCQQYTTLAAFEPLTANGTTGCNPDLLGQPMSSSPKHIPSEPLAPRHVENLTL